MTTNNTCEEASLISLSCVMYKKALKLQISLDYHYMLCVYLPSSFTHTHQQLMSISIHHFTSKICNYKYSFTKRTKMSPFIFLIQICAQDHFSTHMFFPLLPCWPKLHCKTRALYDTVWAHDHHRSV